MIGRRQGSCKGDSLEEGGWGCEGVGLNEFVSICPDKQNVRT